MSTSSDKPSQIIKVNHPAKTDVLVIRFLISCGLLCMLFFIIWFCNPEHVGWAPIYWLLTIGLFFKLGKMLHEWYHYWSVSIPEMPRQNRTWTVDVLTTACPGEPREMIIRTLNAMVRIKYPHVNYLCDEGDDPVLKAACEELGIIHVTRNEKKDAKAGNINNALKLATGQICVVLDPDHVPVEDFLHRTLPYFENPEIGFVQCVQGYSNQSESFIAKAAAEQTYHFYGPMMMSMNTYGTVQAIGANCTFRRKALDSIGGHAAGLSEDMHTAMQLHAKGWKSVYIPEILTRGLVPATLSSYYKQQLKWSRGTFELLFRTYPVLFKNFTWRQKLHYGTIPMYFLLGLVNLIDIVVPLIALSFAQVPWEISLSRFAVFFIPLCGLSIIIRLFAQRWLLEKQERGLHLPGGILRVATWWIFLIGFVYSILNIKVPYIPTPKEDEHENYWKLSIPNAIVLIFCGIAIFYGLSIDWTPYSIAMALYCLINVAILGFVIMISQQKTFSLISSFLIRIPGMNYVFSALVKLAKKAQQLVYKILKHSVTSLLFAVSLVLFSYNTQDSETEEFLRMKDKNVGGFYFGITLSGKERDLKKVALFEKDVQSRCEVISFEEYWKNSSDGFPEKIMNNISEHGAIPMITWKPDFKSYPESYKIFRSIVWGSYDPYLISCAASLRRYKKPVFINFAPEFDNPDNSWSAAGNNSPAEFIEAWQYIFAFFKDRGISNITWVWNPKYSTSSDYFPGIWYVDWIGLKCLNYSKSPNEGKWISFSGLYSSSQNDLKAYKLPLMITELGSASGPFQAAWMEQAINDICKFPEIKSVVIRNAPENIVIYDERTADTALRKIDFSITETNVLRKLAAGLTKAPFINKVFLQKSFFRGLKENVRYKSKFISGTAGQFNLIEDGHPYYIRGVAYNTGHDWRDGNIPLTRRKLEEDFAKIKAMGANTIRRYNFSVYDRNVLNLAEEYNLKVQFGFWFDPEVDYYKDTLRLQRYIKEVEKRVLLFKSHPAVLSWCLGNETWGLIKKKYSKPYLIEVRNGYVKLIEFLAQRIHELDPTRPVFSCIEHEEHQIAGELVALRDGAPSVDVIGVNSYYRQQISQLQKVTSKFDSLRPYLVSEFGPNGYWDLKYSHRSKGLLIEQKEGEKAEWYKEQWTKYIFANKGYNIGGFAYCWSDRMEGSNTWFGLIDHRARLKPSYYALKGLWTGHTHEPIPEFTIASFGMGDKQKYIFKAICNSYKKKGLTYEWKLYKNDYLQRITNIKYNSHDNSIAIKIPDDASHYRLYLYVSDEQGNVSTASLAIPVKIKIKQ